MALPYTLVFGDYTFPNQTFEVKGLPTEVSLDEAALPRRKGTRILASRLGPRKLRISGTLHGTDADTVQEELDKMQAKLADAGQQNLKYRDDRFLRAFLKAFGHSYIEGGFPFLAKVDLTFEAGDPYLYSTSLTTHTEDITTLTGACKVFNVVNPGWVEAVPVYILKPGITVTDNILFHNQTNGDRFRWHGTLVPGMTLTIDSDAQTVLLGSGADGITQFDGDFAILAALTNTFRYAGATMALLKIEYRRRYLA